MFDPHIYLDHAATSPVDPAVAQQLAKDLAELGWNTGTRYELGLTAKKALETSRKTIAAALGCSPEAVVFTSGGTESNNIGLHACCAQHSNGGVLWHSATLHPSLAGPVGVLGDPWQVYAMPCATGGAVDTTQLSDLPAPDVVVLEWVNNEVGFVQPIDSIILEALAQNPRVHIFVDGAQGVGKLPMPAMTPLACFSFSGHKVGAPVGIGVLMVQPGLKTLPLSLGGGQERGWRPGTVPLPLVRALDGALKRTLSQDSSIFAFPAFDDGEFPGAVRRGDGEYSPYITMLDLAPVEGEVLQHHLEEKGIFLGSGSACSASKKGLSPIHKALGMDSRRSRCTLRWSSAPGQDEEVLHQAWHELVLQWRELKRFFRG
jgi:cysteine desulfurase